MCIKIHFRPRLKGSAQGWKRTVVDTTEWGREILPDGQNSEVSKLGKLDKIGARLGGELGISNEFRRGCIETWKSPTK